MAAEKTLGDVWNADRISSASFSLLNIRAEVLLLATIAYFGASRPVISVHRDHQFRSIANTHFGLSATTFGS